MASLISSRMALYLHQRSAANRQSTTRSTYEQTPLPTPLAHAQARLHSRQFSNPRLLHNAGLYPPALSPNLLRPQSASCNLWSRCSLPPSMGCGPDRLYLPLPADPQILGPNPRHWQVRRYQWVLSWNLLSDSHFRCFSHRLTVTYGMAITGFDVTKDSYFGYVFD